MDHRDDWPDEILEGDIDVTADLEPSERLSAERIARDGRNMNAVLSAMANQVNEGLPAVVDEQVIPLGRRPAWSRRAMVSLAAAAVIAALMLMRGGEIEESGRPLESPTASPAPSMMAEMAVEADRPFAVFPTSDPNIAVVWLFNPEESD